MEFYAMMVACAPPHSHFVEVGSYKGRSSAFLAVEIFRSQKPILLDCVDLWDDQYEQEVGKTSNTLPDSNKLWQSWCQNVESVKSIITPRRMSSLDGAKLYQDQSLNFVFIDADHSYQAVVADIQAWLPKVKRGGYIAGHDYQHQPIVQATNEILGWVSQKGGCWYRQVA